MRFRACCCCVLWKYETVYEKKIKKMKIGKFVWNVLLSSIYLTWGLLLSANNTIQFPQTAIKLKTIFRDVHFFYYHFMCFISAFIYMYICFWLAFVKSYPYDLAFKSSQEDFFLCKIQPIKIKVEFQVGLIITTEKLCKNYSVHQKHTKIEPYRGVARIWRRALLKTLSQIV